MDWVIIAVLVALALTWLGWLLSYTAARLDRMHARVDGATAALDAYVVRRAEASMALAISGALDPASGLLLASAAAESLERTSSRPNGDLLRKQDFGDRAQVESDLTEILHMVLPSEVCHRLHHEGGDNAAAVQRVRDAGVRLQLARSFHAEAVAEAAALRSQPIVRVFRLAGHAPWPRAIEFDDDLPEGLADWPTL